MSQCKCGWCGGEMKPRLYPSQAQKKFCSVQCRRWAQHTRLMLNPDQCNLWPKIQRQRKTGAAQRKKATALLRQGLPVAEVAKRLGVSRQRVYVIKREQA